MQVSYITSYVFIPSFALDISLYLIFPIYIIYYIYRNFLFWYFLAIDLLPLCHFFYLHICYSFKLYSLTSLCTCYSLFIICYFHFSMYIDISIYIEFSFWYKHSCTLSFLLIHGVYRQVDTPSISFLYLLFRFLSSDPIISNNRF